MSKFKIKLKLQGLELEVEGSREDVPMISQNIGHQMAALLQPAGAIVEGEVLDGSTPQHVPLSATSPATNDRKSARRRRGSSTSHAHSSEGTSAEAIDWRHDPAKFGMPQQDWNTAKKSLWLLYVVSEVTANQELSASLITATFNKHFRQAGLVKASNVSRDLGLMKIKSLPFVGEDNTKTPAMWFLTDSGRKHVQELIAAAVTKAA